MLKNLISESLYSLISGFCDIRQIEEIRVRASCPVVLCINGKNIILKDNNNPYFATDDDLNYIISRATQNSLYAINDQVKQLFISYSGGIRIGLTGEVVYNGQNITTIKHINSVNIRLPREVKNFANIALNFIVSGSKINSTLVVSEPGAGKTTLLRDICRGLSDYSTIFNVLLVDERYEIACTNNGRPLLDVGYFTDIVSGGSKQFAFSNAIRSLKPNVIITDELGGAQDYDAVTSAVNSGVAVIASVHAKNQLELLKNPKIKQMLSDNIFSRIVVLSASSPNRYVGIYDNNLKLLYMPY